MIATERFVFLHLHKSAGTFFNEWLLRFVPGARQIGYHLPRRMIPDSLSDLPALGLVRNPWSYYVSWYSFQRDKPSPNALFRTVSNDGRNDFNGTVRNLLSLHEGGPMFDKVAASLPGQYTNHGLNLPGFAFREILGSGRGFYGFLYEYLYGAGRGTLHIGRTEFLSGDMQTLFNLVGQPMTDAMLTELRSAEPRNASRHGAYTEYYDAELQQLVARVDSPIIERHNYVFGA